MKRRFKCLVFLAFLAASSSAFAGGGGGGGESGPFLSDEDWNTLCVYVGFAILVVLVLFVVGALIAWASAPCRERYRKARVWRDAMNALPQDDPPSAPPVSAD